MVTLQMKNGIYKGEVRNGLPFGNGTFYFGDGARCEGIWKERQKGGHGYFIDPENNSYVAEWFILKKSKLVRITTHLPPNLCEYEATSKQVQHEV